MRLMRSPDPALMAAWKCAGFGWRAGSHRISGTTTDGTSWPSEPSGWRDAGALTVLPIALTYRAGVHVHAGEFEAAEALIEEAEGITVATGEPPLRYTSLVLAAWRGQEGHALQVIEAGVRDAKARGEGRVLALAGCFTAVLYNGLGRYGDTLVAAQGACEFDDLGLYGWALIELIEAAARSDERELARDAMRRLEERTRASGTDWALGIQARSEALVNEDQDADACYREAIERLSRSRIGVHLARARLVYGEWLRRRDRRVDARQELRTTYEGFRVLRGARLRRASPPRVGGYGRTRPPTPARSSRCAYRPGSTYRQIGTRRAHEPRDR